MLLLLDPLAARPGDGGAMLLFEPRDEGIVGTAVVVRGLLLLLGERLCRL